MFQVQRSVGRKTADHLGTEEFELSCDALTVLSHHVPFQLIALYASSARISNEACGTTYQCQGLYPCSGEVS